MKVKLPLSACCAASALVMLSLAGCKRSVCEPVPLTGFWENHKELVPPGATVCSTKPSGGTENLELDFPEDQNPFVTIAKHMESKGFRRTAQTIDNPDVQSMMLERGTPGPDFMVVGVNLARRDGIWEAIIHTETKK